MAENLMCPLCGSVKSSYYFYKSPVLGGGKYLPYCKVCCNKKFEQYVKILDNEEAALWCTLVENGVPFKKEVWNAAYKEKDRYGDNTPKGWSLISAYMRIYDELGVAAYGIWDSDAMLFDFWGDAPASNKGAGDVPMLDYNEEVIKWGRFEKDGELDDEAYQYMNQSFANYTKDLTSMSTNLENRYRDLVKAEWRKRKADETGDVQEIARAQKNLSDMLNMLKLNNFQDTNISNEQRAFEKKIAMIEQFEPAECEDLQVYLDMVGYEKDKAQLMRSLRNAIANTREYPDISQEEV